MKIDNFYGKHSSGASFEKMDDDFFNKKNILITSKLIKKNLKKMSITNNDLKDKTIMNVGSGREALGLLSFKPKEIFHYDISHYNIIRFKKYIKTNNLNRIIKSRRLDLSKNSLPRKKFDFIYLHGIIQHVDHVDKAVKNLILSMKLNGKMWFYFYRPGSLNVFLASLQRKLLKNIKIKKFQNFLQKRFERNFIDKIMDDCYVPNFQLFYPDNYKKNFVINFGNTFLKNYSHKVDFLNYHQSVVFFLKKKRDISKISINGLNKSRQENVLKTILYKNKKYHDLKNIISNKKIKKDIDIFNIVVKLEFIKLKIKNIFFKNHKLTQQELTKSINDINLIFN
ncbi:methyltransferase domain-containing protein [Candidatus Pelagibacter communis]|uniref:methyltransferase domain-containing protein n=1 Tax=Candidatus Pelagibacter TaxID=198251 RepID=UPI003EE2786D